MSIEHRSRSNWSETGNGYRRETTIDLGPSGILAKVTAISDEGNSVYFDLRNGKTGSLNNVDQEYLIGDVLLITGDIDNNRVEIEKVPSSTWPDNLWVGIVKIKLPDISVIDSGARFRAVPTVTTPFYESGNTVLAGDVQGVTRVLSERPIKYIDLPEAEQRTEVSVKILKGPVHLLES